MSHPFSQFLPSDFRPEAGVVLLAGKGKYPQILADKFRALDIPVALVAFHHETSDDLWQSFPDEARHRIHVGQLGKLLKILPKIGYPHAIMAGQITPKKLFRGLRPDWKTFCLLRSLPQKNAETIFGAVAQELAHIGVHLLDGRAGMDEHLATAGQMGKHAFKIKESFLQHGIEIAKEVARLDIGQGIVFHKGTVLAVEAFEGTDNMLRRVGEFPAKQPCFVKTVKPQQDYRFDVPVFGLTTIKHLAEAKIRHVALEAGATIMLNKPAVIEAANQHKIALWGY